MKRISILLILVLLVSCGNKIAELKSAPTTQNQTGIITTCSTRSEAELLSQTHGIQFRVLNEKRKLIEYVGIDQESLKKLLPKIKMVKNILYKEKLISSQNISAQYVQDKPFYGAHSPRYRDSSAGNYFKHLSQIDGVNLSDYQGEGVTIAIIDTGVYYNHPHLSPNILVNQSESNANGTDNDQNGLIDDHVGWDFYNGDAYPIDDNGHGTHVAGLAASTYSGVAPKAKILPIKVLGSNGQGDLGTIAQGVLYAIDKGADIINLSLGGTIPSLTQDLQRLINSVEAAKNNNSLIIAASGNGGADGVGDCNDGAPIYPANINSDNVIAVGAVNLYNELTSYSNYGINTVDVAAPGGDQYTGGLLSTGIPYCNGPCSSSDQTYVENIGTSMATPITAGLAALIKSKYPDYTYKQIKFLIESSVTFFQGLNDQVKVSGVVNVKSALNR